MYVRHPNTNGNAIRVQMCSGWLNECKGSREVEAKGSILFVEGFHLKFLDVVVYSLGEDVRDDADYVVECLC